MHILRNGESEPSSWPVAAVGDHDSGQKCNVRVDAGGDGRERGPETDTVDGVQPPAPVEDKLRPGDHEDHRAVWPDRFPGVLANRDPDRVLRVDEPDRGNVGLVRLARGSPPV